MNALHRAMLLIGLGLAGNASAGNLTPYQEAALQKMLATMPAEQRAMARPHLEASLANLSKAQIDMMLAGLAGKMKEEKAAPAPANNGAVGTGDSEWGAAEADFNKVFGEAQGYIGRISDVRDASGEPDLCQRALNGVPIGRRRAAAMADVLGQQDRQMLRLMVDYRARYGTVDSFAKQVGQPVSSPMVQGVKHFFAPPMGEREVSAKLQAIQAEAKKLAEAHERERIKIANGNYADRGAGVFSKSEEKLLAELDERTAKATAKLCEPGMEYYHRGLASLVEPVVPKVRRHVQ